ncbi:hypothetical protein [Microvirga calopogonii]|uniref:hypothetical protein n=1 Tax=Microvirga calopogonii TaxID=2078013 RepID=UPI000E0D3072|nr:hypothetical protein [Microvirga calopogonii]
MIAAVPAILSILRSRFTWSVAAAGLVVLAWLHYQGLRADLTDALIQAKLANEARKSAEVRAAENAEAAAQADRDRKAVVDALEELQGRVANNANVARGEERTVQSAPTSDDGPVAPLLEGLRQRRFAK